MFFRIFRIKFLVLILLAAISISCFNMIGGYLHIKGPLKEDRILIIESGMSTSQIAQKLKLEGIINYPYVFEIVYKLYYPDSSLKHGEYKFTTGITPAQVIEKLISGKSLIHKFFVPEGLSVSEIISAINEENLLGTIHEDIPEGYLMPSTYHYSYGDKKEKIISMMKESMSKSIDEAVEKLSPDSPLKTRKDILILASIIEKEAANDLEKPMIAAVFLNRLNKKMKLQADPTVLYAITFGKNKLGRTLTKSDLSIKSPYNTYYVDGLPAGPICCPGKKSIMAAVTPAKTDALYFVVNGYTGTHAFSSNLNDHNSNVQKYRQFQQMQKLNKESQINKESQN